MPTSALDLYLDRLLARSALRRPADKRADLGGPTLDGPYFTEINNAAAGGGGYPDISFDWPDPVPLPEVWWGSALTRAIQQVAPRGVVEGSRDYRRSPRDGPDIHYTNVAWSHARVTDDGLPDDPAVLAEFWCVQTLLVEATRELLGGDP